MTRVVVSFFLVFIAQLHAMNLKTSSDGIIILGDKKDSKETFAFVNKEKTSFMIYKVEKLTPKTLKLSIAQLDEKINCNTVSKITIKESTILSLAGISKLFPLARSLFIQNNIIEEFAFEIEDNFEKIIVESNTMTKESESQLLNLKKTLGDNLTVGNNTIRY